MLTKTLSEAKKKQRSIMIKAMNNDIGSIDSAKDSWNPAQISERAKDISYIRSLVDSWNPAQLNEALKMLDLPVIDTWNPAQIEEQRRNLVFYLAERTLTGNPITLKILGNLTPEVTRLKVTMKPIQDLSHGNPSPTNICPISGRTEVSVTRTAGEDVETKTAEFSETVYEGETTWYEDGSCKLKILKAYTQYDKNFVLRNADSTSTFTYFDLEPTLTGAIDWDADVDSNIFAKQGVYPYAQITGDKKLRIAYKLADNMTEAKLRQVIEDVGYLQVCYHLSTPIEIELSSEEITLLKGNNVLSTDGDSIELKYKQNF